MAGYAKVCVVLLIRFAPQYYLRFTDSVMLSGSVIVLLVCRCQDDVAQCGALPVVQKERACHVTRSDILN